MVGQILATNPQANSDKSVQLLGQFLSQRICRNYPEFVGIVLDLLEYFFFLLFFGFRLLIELLLWAFVS